MSDLIRIFNSVDALAQFFAKELARDIEGNPGGNFFSIALSGGSTPQVVFTHLASNFSKQIDWSKVKLFWGDERCVPPGSRESNFRMARENLLDHIPLPVSNIFRIKGEADPVKESKRYEQILRQHVSTVQDIPQLDLLILGIGEDGHTASIFPGNTLLFNSEKLVEAVVNPYNKQKRITLTGTMINQARTIVFLVTGDSKAEIAARILERKNGWEKCPASLVHPLNGDVLWLLDDRAASKLNKTIIDER